MDKKIKEDIKTEIEKVAKKLTRLEANKEKLLNQKKDLEGALRVIQRLDPENNEESEWSPQPGSVGDFILRALTVFGRGAQKHEIAEMLEKIGHPVKPNTLTGTLQRLRVNKKINNNKGLWHIETPANERIIQSEENAFEGTQGGGFVSEGGSGGRKNVSSNIKLQKVPSPGEPDWEPPWDDEEDEDEPIF